jgi:hypothetical protein
MSDERGAMNGIQFNVHRLGFKSVRKSRATDRYWAAKVLRFLRHEDRDGGGRETQEGREAVCGLRVRVHLDRLIPTAGAVAYKSSAGCWGSAVDFGSLHLLAMAGAAVGDMKRVTGARRRRFACFVASKSAIAATVAR